MYLGTVHKYTTDKKSKNGIGQKTFEKPSYDATKTLRKLIRLKNKEVWISKNSTKLTLVIDGNKKVFDLKSKFGVTEVYNLICAILLEISA